MMSRRPPDEQTLELFKHQPNEGDLDISAELRHLLSRAIKDSGQDRFAIASRMSRFMDRDITRHMLNAWSAESREEWRFPFEAAPAFQAVCETTVLTELLARTSGGRFMTGDESLLAELGRIEQQKHQLRIREDELKTKLVRRRR